MTRVSEATPCTMLIVAEAKSSLKAPRTSHESCWECFLPHVMTIPNVLILSWEFFSPSFLSDEPPSDFSGYKDATGKELVHFPTIYLWPSALFPVLWQGQDLLLAKDSSSSRRWDPCPVDALKYHFLFSCVTMSHCC